MQSVADQEYTQSKTIKHFWDNNLIPLKFETMTPNWFQQINPDFLSNYTYPMACTSGFVLLPGINNDSIIMVNSKQANRIIRRREQRSNNKKVLKAKKPSIKEDINADDHTDYQYLSRHKHACRRQRNKSGRFLSKKEKEES